MTDKIRIRSCGEKLLLYQQEFDEHAGTSELNVTFQCTRPEGHDSRQHYHEGESDDGRQFMLFWETRVGAKTRDT